MNRNSGLLESLAPGAGGSREATPSNERLGRELFERGAVEIVQAEGDRASARIAGESRRTVELALVDGGLQWRCSCRNGQERFCKHAVAVSMALLADGRPGPRTAGGRRMSRSGIAYEEAGEGRPFMALHGYSLDRRMSIGAFEPLLQSSGLRRIYPDLPFMGESDDRAAGRGHDGFLDSVCGFIDELVPEGPFLIAGESFGGYIARGVAARMGERVAGIFLLCPSTVAGPVGREPAAFEVRSEEPGWRQAALEAGATEADLADYEEHAVTRSLSGFLRTRAEVIAGIRLARLEAMERHFAGDRAFSFDGFRGSLGGEPFDPIFDRPACLFLGRQDRSVGWRDPLMLLPRYPRASAYVVDGCGHNAQIDRPEVFAAAFRDWLRICEESA